jgi:phage terminase small subunit
MALNARQTLFVQEYLACHNGTQAAIRSGYSAKTARAIASENLKKPAIAAEIARGRARLRKRSSAQTKMVTRELSQVA